VCEEEGGGTANEAGNFAYNRFFAVGLFRQVGWWGIEGGGGGGGGGGAR
jgi:hypothetical protein